MDQKLFAWILGIPCNLLQQTPRMSMDCESNVLGVVTLSRESGVLMYLRDLNPSGCSLRKAAAEKRETVSLGCSEFSITHSTETFFLDRHFLALPSGYSWYSFLQLSVKGPDHTSSVALQFETVSQE